MPAIPRSRTFRTCKIELGRFYNAEDLQQRGARVCAGLGSQGKAVLRPLRPGTRRFASTAFPYEVVGVLKPRPQEGNDNNINRVVYIPFSTLSDFRDTHYVDMIWLDFLGYDYGSVQTSIRNTLAAQHSFRPDDKRALFVFSLMEQLSQFRMITIALQVLLAFIGALTLGIGGVGLMNIMLVSVTQRTREIGVEKALGARRLDVLMQFLSEALAITFLGGLCGIVLAYIVSLLGRRPHFLQCPGQARRNGRHSTHHFTGVGVGFYQHSGAGGIGQRHDSSHTCITARSD